MSLLPRHTTLAILSSHKQGHAMQCLGVARALGLEPEIRPVRPRGLFKLIAPWGPADPGDRNGAQATLRAPFPDIAIASGRETVPYLRAMKRLSAGRTFTVYLGDPRVSHRLFDLIALPEHDACRGANVVTHLTPPHPRGEAERAEAARNPDARVAALKSPRIALLVGGPSGAYSFTAQDYVALAELVTVVLASGASLMITFSRRTPAALVTRIRDAVSAPDMDWSRLFIWDGEGANPYLSMLALADGFIVTADSVSMLAETVATGRPVHLYEPTGDAGKFRHLIAKLMERDAARPWSGRLENWTPTPIDATPDIAAEIARRYHAFCARLERAPPQRAQ